MKWGICEEFVERSFRIRAWLFCYRGVFGLLEERKLFANVLPSIIDLHFCWKKICLLPLNKKIFLLGISTPTGYISIWGGYYSYCSNQGRSVVFPSRYAQEAKKKKKTTSTEVGLDKKGRIFWGFLEHQEIFRNFGEF